MRFVWAPVNWATGSLSKWIVVAVAAVTSGLALTIVGAATLESDPVAGLPADAESTGLTRLQQQLPSSQVEPALVVYSRLGGLTEQDRTAIDASRRDLAQAALGGRVAPPVQAADGTAAFVIVPLSANLSDEDLRAAVEDIRATAQAVSPSGLSAQVTGAPAFEVDIGAVFDGADITLLLTTAAVVAVLLLLTYRSPWLWLVPLTVIVVADQMAAKLVSILTQLTGLDVDAATVGITSVLVFGAGTNYALLIIARYREELRQLPDRHQAMRRALHSAAPAIIASSGTVVLALLTLLFAVSPLERSLGVTGAVGIAVAVLYALVVLPAVLLLFGRGLFWPFTPRVGQPDPTRTGPWSKVGAAVVRRPRTVIAASLLLLAALGLGGIGLKTGLSQTEQFRTSVEATEGQQTLARSFPAGAATPAAIISTAQAAEEIRRAAESVPGVARSVVGATNGRITQVDAVLRDEPGTAASFQTVTALRAAVRAVPNAEAVVGGSEAADLDARLAASRDRQVIIPLVLAVVLVVLLVLLRSVVAAVLLVLTVVASYGASLGASWLALYPTLRVPRPRPRCAAAGLLVPCRAGGRLQHLPHHPRPRRGIA